MVSKAFSRGRQKACAERKKPSKEDFDRRLQRSKTIFENDQYVFVRQEDYRKANGRIAPKKQKLSLVAEGPLEVTELNQRTVTIKKLDGKPEKVSRDQVVQARGAQKNESKQRLRRRLTSREMTFL